MKVLPTGTRVKIRKSARDDAEPMDPIFEGREGVIIIPGAGTGVSDMINVEVDLPDGSKRSDAFWPEELDVLRSLP